MDRQAALSQLANQDQVWDLAIVGGGSTGLGVALDAVSRGYKVLLVEQSDFAKGTSSRSTKLVHGGVRYLAQGDVMLVLEALKERGRLLKNAPHLTKNQSFVIPIYTLFDRAQYTVGLKLYDYLAGSLSLGHSHFVSRSKTMQLLPTIKTEGLKGGVIYQDGQFDDSRLALNVAQTCAEAGACVLNYTRVTGLTKDRNGRLDGITVQDAETGTTYTAQAKAVINATGVFVDDLLQMDQPAKKKMIRPSQGVHLVLDSSFLQSDHAIMIPKTSDGRVLFCVPWHGKVVVGTTDTLKDQADMEPMALEREIEFILETAQAYLSKKPTRDDVLSVYAGLRPLAAPQGDGKSTKEISRSHKIMVSDSGLITITGGKWTTFRKMGEDTVDKAIEVAKLPKTTSDSANTKIHGYRPNPDQSNPFYYYGADEDQLRRLMAESPEMAQPLHAKYPYVKAQVIFAARHEMARTVEDVLSRRMRMLFLDAEAAQEMAPAVARLLATELGQNQAWVDEQIHHFNQVASRYVIEPVPAKS
jgi:glycerol-3-phosphate dehydrogenase